jgi:hypothetical protein
VSFKAGGDIDGLTEAFGIAAFDGASVDHDRRSVVPGHGHDTWIALVPKRGDQRVEGGYTHPGMFLSHPGMEMFASCV